MNKSASEFSGTKRIGEALLEAEYIESNDLDAALAYQKENGGKIVEVLMHLGAIDPPAFEKFLESLRGMPTVNLSLFTALPDVCDLVPRNLAVEYEVFPIDKLGKLLTVGAAVPLTERALKQLRQASGLSVKAVLCSPVDIHAAIDEHYPESETPAGQNESSFASTISTQRIVSLVKLGAIGRLIQGIESLPTLPDTVEKVRAAVEEGVASTAEIAEIIERDPPITANVLRLANSAAYAFPNAVGDVRHATTLLGLREIQDVVLRAAVLDVASRSGDFDFHKYWADATFCATVAKRIAEQANLNETGSAYTAGLLHDIGRFALVETAAKRYQHLNPALRGDQLLATEELLLGVTHPEVGYLLAQHWSLPDEIADGIRFHHRPADANNSQPIVQVVSIAATVSEARCDGGDFSADSLSCCASSVATLSLADSQITEIYHQTLSEATEHTRPGTINRS